MPRIKTEKELMERVISMLPRQLKGKDVIHDVEIDPYNNGDSPDGISYWIYINDGYRTENGRGCHTIHEDTLTEIKRELKRIVTEK